MTTRSKPGRRRLRAHGPRRLLRDIAVAFLLLTLLLTGSGILLVYTSLLTPLSTDRKAAQVRVVVPPGSDAQAIGKLLVSRGVIRHARGFQLALMVGHISPRSLHPGTYILSPAMPPGQIAAIIALGRTAAPPVVVPEGFTVRQIAARLARKGLASDQEFLAVATTRGRTFHIDGFTPPSDNLEGFLFPDSYAIAPGTPVRSIIATMLGNFREQARTHGGGELARRKDVGRVITMASMVEREAKVPGDRSLIAAVLYNRLKHGMKLQCDATVEYALPEHKDRLFYKDLAIPSVYNTYLHPGLPPTPIANPGWPSIQAAMHPAHVGYLYYVARPDGSHIFTTTLADHKKAVLAARALRAAALASPR